MEHKSEPSRYDMTITIVNLSFNKHVITQVEIWIFSNLRHDKNHLTWYNFNVTLKLGHKCDPIMCWKL